MKQKKVKKSWDKYSADSLLNVPGSIKNLPASGVDFNVGKKLKVKKGY